MSTWAFMFEYSCLQCKDKISKCLTSAMFRNSITSATPLHLNIITIHIPVTKRLKSSSKNSWINHFSYVAHFLSTCQPIQNGSKHQNKFSNDLKLIIISQHHDSEYDKQLILYAHFKFISEFILHFEKLWMPFVWSFAIHWYQIFTIHIHTHANLHASIVYVKVWHNDNSKHHWMLSLLIWCLM